MYYDPVCACGRHRTKRSVEEPSVFLDLGQSLDKEVGRRSLDLGQGLDPMAVAGTRLSMGPFPSSGQMVR